MIRAFLQLIVPVVLAAAAEAGTVTVTPDASTYVVGQTITLNVVGNPQGGAATGIWGRLRYSAALTHYSVRPTQNTHTIAGGGSALVGPLTQGVESGVGYADAFNQLFGSSSPVSVEQNTTSVIKVRTRAEGTLHFFWEEQVDGLGNHLVYFDATPPDPAATVTIVPEPGTAAPIALALLGLLASPRRR